MCQKPNVPICLKNCISNFISNYNLPNYQKKYKIQFKSFCFIYYVVKVMIQYNSFWIVLSLYQTGTIYMVHRSSLQCS